MKHPGLSILVLVLCLVSCVDAESAFNGDHPLWTFKRNLGNAPAIQTFETQTAIRVASTVRLFADVCCLVAQIAVSAIRIHLAHISANPLGLPEKDLTHLARRTIGVVVTDALYQASAHCSHKDQQGKQINIVNIREL